MTAHISKPFVHVEDANGNPYVGASLYIYDVGTTTKKAIYSDTALSVSVTNPLTSDSAGNFSRVYVASGTYKLRAETSTGTLIWEYDNIDTGLTAGSGALAITGGGTGATTAASARSNLGAAAQTDVDDLADEIADIQTTLQAIVAAPQGRLTLTSATPVLVTGVSAGTSVYYTPYIGKLFPLYDGSQINMETFSELTLTLNSNHVANAIYDCFVFKNSGTVILGTGPAWNTATAGSGARGTGAGTTELTRTIGGIWTNANSMTVRNGATTYTVAANQGTYVGSIAMDGSAGQVTCHTTWGQSRKFSVWNAYNRVRIVLQVGDATASWTYNTANWRSSNNAAANTMTVLSGLPDEWVDSWMHQKIQCAATTGVSGEGSIGVGLNSTSSPSGQTGLVQANQVGATTVTPASMTAGRYRLAPFIGINALNAIEKGGGASVACTFYGAESLMSLSAEWMG